MTPRNESELYVMGVLSEMGLHFVKANHILHRKDGSEETEIDLVFTHFNLTFIIEVSENAQNDARRLKRKDLRTWRERGLAERISTELGLPRSNHICVVYISPTSEDSSVPDMGDDVVLLNWDHVGELEVYVGEDEHEYGLEAFVKWCGMDDKLDLSK